MIYYLPLEIAGTRFHIASLKPLTAAERNPPPIKQYILSKDPVQTHLFNIDADTYFIAHGGMNDDLDWDSFHIDFNDKSNQLIINFKTSIHTDNLLHHVSPFTNANPTHISCKNLPSPIQTKAKNQKYENFAIALKSIPQDTIQVVLNLVAAENVVTHSTTWLLHIIPNENIWNIALDFGSEASQLYIPRANKGDAINALPIIPNLKAFYTHHESLENNLFMQSDTDGFFRSVFLRASEGVLQQTHAPNEPQELVQMLTPETLIVTLQNQKYKLLPTIKLATFGIGGTESLKVNGKNQQMSHLSDKIHRKLIFNFLHIACKTITADRDRYIRFKLLVPNVFNQTKITDLVEKVERDSVHFIQKFPDYKLKGIEISTLSESDAAFAGYQPPTAHPLIANGKYLIIDVGRGTTDYSIVQTSTADKAIGLYRSGFIGAGALLTFAFLDTFVTQVMKEHYTTLQKEKELSRKERELFYKTVICDSDATWQTTFFQLIEQLKRNSGRRLLFNKTLIPEITGIPKVSNLFDISLDTLNGWLKIALKNAENRSMPDYFGFIKQTTDALVQHLLTEIQKIPNEFAEINQFDGVILSGRGFLYQPLVTALKTKFGPEKVHLAESLKNICIEGAFTEHRFNGNCNMIGIPYAAEVYGDKQKIKMQPALEPEQPPKKPSFLDRFNLDALFGEKAPISSQAKLKKANANYYRDIEGFLKGYGYTHFNSANEKIYISGKNYIHHLPETNDSVNLFFTGRNFIIRSYTTAQTLEPISTLATAVEKNFAAKTLFPILGERESVPVDKIPDLNPAL